MLVRVDGLEGVSDSSQISEKLKIHLIPFKMALQDILDTFSFYTTFEIRRPPQAYVFLYTTYQSILSNTL
jgi:hypothetical protein